MMTKTCRKCGQEFDENELVSGYCLRCDKAIANDLEAKIADEYEKGDGSWDSEYEKDCDYNDFI